MESISGDEFELSDGQESTVQDEKIFVAVRLRPLNEKEIAKNDASDWECINNTTIVFKNNQPERPTYPNLYTFDRVYGCDNSTKQVYEEGVKGIALSVLNGINSTIFAYGQTSSGKTYTMSGITEYTIADIYDHISKQNDREFVLKFSAIEIYNECVKDLLSLDGAPLRLLDDPEKGTVVEKLTEATLRDRNHLKELIYLCEAERQIGETALNEMSSRSHQILRLTVESSAREFRGGDNGKTLAATVNFVDLAGSERASQTLAAGARLKEGCHINRSLLTLGTVVRKLSKRGGGHIPYRNSKLTRILQNSLGGNARTAILCTICPAHSHVEQSRNTLLFASCAKDVTTNAQVNVVTSDKALVKQLQQELARLEKELRTSPASIESTSIIRDMELQMEKMEKEIEELTRQRDLAQSRLEHLIQLTGADQNSLPWEEPDHLYEKDVYRVVDPLRFGASLNNYRLSNMEDSKDSKISFVDHHFLDENSPRKFLDQYSLSDPYQQSEKIFQEIVMNSEDGYKEDQNSERTSSIDNDITINSEERCKEDQHIEKAMSTDNNFTINPKDSYNEDRIIKKTSSIDNDITINQEDSCKENQHIEKTSSIDDYIKRHPEDNYNEDLVIEKTSNINDNITRYPEANYSEDRFIEKTSDVDDNVTRHRDTNYYEDRVIEKTSNTDDSITRYPEANYSEDRFIEKTSDGDDNVTIHRDTNYYEDRVIEKTSNTDDSITRYPEANYSEDRSIEKTSDVDDNVTRYRDANYNEDRIIEKTSNIDDNITRYPEANYNEDRVIEKTSNIDDNITRHPEANYYEDRVIEETSNTDDKITTNLQDNKDDQCIEETPSIDNNITINREDNRKEDQPVIVKTSSLETNFVVNPDDHKEDRHIEKTLSVDNNNINAEEAHINDSHDNRKEKTKGIQTTVEPTEPNHEEPSPCSSDTEISDSEDISFTRSKSCKEFITDASSPLSEKETMTESTNDNEFEGNFSGKQVIPRSKSDADVKTASKQDSDSSVENEDFNEKKIEQKIKSSTEGDVNSDHSFKTKSLNELMTDDPEVVSSDKTVNELEQKANESTEIIAAPDKNWPTIFEKQRRNIIKLWDECNTPLIHRTYFFLLFNGDQSDSVYMEVEFRRLSFLKKTPSRAISTKALSRERISLSKMLLKKFSSTQRDTLFQNWGIPLDSKHRRVQLCRLVWTKTDDLDHIKDSAELVAQMVGIVELNHTPKELFGLSFLPKPTIYKTNFWKASMSFG